MSPLNLFPSFQKVSQKLFFSVDVVMKAKFVPIRQAVGAQEI
jgi:hypothetical protein